LSHKPHVQSQEKIFSVYSAKNKVRLNSTLIRSTKPENQDSQRTSTTKLKRLSDLEPEPEEPFRLESSQIDNKILNTAGVICQTEMQFEPVLKRSTVSKKLSQLYGSDRVAGAPRFAQIRTE
jgi:hypothetical protein